ncbi:MAG: UvrD-helicase domain-containing protein [Planctomycetaceae bacterium]|jgi:ATP-dependent exoDNAse (exonuclease V) beta subunit|nr:UvrD-helicase domain-containing protein [Planctomycetaceae bacterium]
MSNIVIQASAGSGKTMQISNSFLEILFRDVDVDSILASTFTRKAAGEITDRILNRLANAVTGNEHEINNMKNLMPKDTLPNTTNQNDYINSKLFGTLAKLVRNLYKVRICTLDSFFSRIASTFFLELGFPSGWSIIIENEFEKIINESIHGVLENSEKNHARKIMFAIQQGDQDINVTKKLRELASNVMPLVRESSPAAWENNVLLSKELEDVELDSISEQLQNAELPVTKTTGKTDARFDKVHKKVLDIIAKNDWATLLKDGLVKKIIEHDYKYYSSPIEGDLLDSLSQFIVHARAVELNKVVGITRAMRELFDLIVSGYDKIAMRDRVLRFDDVTNRLSNLFKPLENKLEFQSLFQSILHRTNSKIDHLLLDEFQDTSKSQWNIIEPFVKYVTQTAGNTFLCVGDVKQAIYGWRGGVSEIFTKINSAVPDIETSELKKSYRSCQVVIDAVNRIFCNIKSNAALENYPNAAESWQNRMMEHETARTELDGYCLLEVAPESIYDDVDAADKVETDDSGNDENVEGVASGYTNYVVNRIIEISNRHPDCSIGILVTKNQQNTDLMNEFRRRNFDASEEGGSKITDSAAVQCVLSAMQLADHPDDGVARFHLVNSPLAEDIGLQKYDGGDDGLLAANAALRLRREIMEDGYGKVIERFAAALAPSCNKREYQRLEKLLELAYQFQENAAGARTKQFISMINNKKVESPSAADNIKVMTIHKSKGMQFDIVVLPYLSGKLDKSEHTPPFIAGRENAVAEIDLVIKYMNKELQSVLPQNPDSYRKAFSDYIDGNVNESLSVLYVAMTRAIHELVMIIQPPTTQKTTTTTKPKPKPKNITDKITQTLGGVLCAGLRSVDDVDNVQVFGVSDSEKLVLYEAGNLNWVKRKSKSVIDSEVAGVDVGNVIRIGEVLSKRKKYRILSRITPSTHKSIVASVKEKHQSELIKAEKIAGVDREFFGDGVGGDDKFGREFAMLRGKMIHACFETWLGREIWLGDVAIDREFLRAAIEEVIRGEGYVGTRAEELNIDKEAVIRSFIEICEKPDIRAVLSRTRYKGSNVEVQHERRFAVLYNESELMHGSIDRLVVERESGKVINIEVIDFKTDRKGTDIDEDIFIEQRRKFHENQMEAYQKGMAKLYRVDRSRINVTLIFTNIGRAIPALKPHKQNLQQPEL